MIWLWPLAAAMTAALALTLARPLRQADGRGRGAALAITIAVPALALPLYLHWGRPALPDRPLAARGEALAARAELQARAETLAARLGKAEKASAGPEEGAEGRAEGATDAAGWAELARLRTRLDQPAAAARAWSRAIAASDPAPAAYYGARGAARARANDGIVPPDAIADFKAALAAEPGRPRARYFLALARHQAGDRRAALRRWALLAAETPPGAPWRAELQARIRETASALGEPATAWLPPGEGTDEKDAAETAAALRESSAIRAMVARLEARLEAGEGDADGWARLARARRVLGAPEAAGAALRRAIELAPERVDLRLALADLLLGQAPPEGPWPAELEAQLRAVRTRDPDNPHARLLLGAIAARRGEAAEARRLWRALARDLPAGSPARAAVEARLAALSPPARPQPEPERR